MPVTRKARFWIAGALVVLAAIAGYWYFSPYLTIRTLYAAAQAEDFETLNRHVDYVQLRANVKEQLNAALAEKMKGLEGHPLAGLGSSVASMVANATVETFVRPVFVAYMLRTGEADPKAAGAPASAAPPASAPAEPGSSSKAPRWRLERVGVNRVMVHRVARGEPRARDKVVLVLDRQGFADWKLTGVRLPLQADAPAASR